MLQSCRLSLILILTFLGTWVQADGSRFEFHHPSIDLDMLAFDDEEHYRGVMDELIELQETRDTSESSDERRASVFQDFTESLGFESLLSYIEYVENAFDDGELDLASLGGTLDNIEPSKHPIIDPYLRGLVNPQGELMVGTTIYRYYPHGYFRIENRDLEALRELRNGSQETESPNTTFISYRTSVAGCCLGTASKVQYKEYADGLRRIKGQQWNRYRAGQWHTGVSTENQRLRNNGRWVKARADVIGQQGIANIAINSCSIKFDIEFDKHKTNKRRVEVRHKDGGLANPVKVSKYFESTHYATDSGDSVELDMALCECEEAQASFTLPESATASSSVVLDGSASTNEALHFIEIHLKGGNRYWSSWFSGGAGTRNLSNHYNFSDPGGNGTVYVVKLAVQNGCTPWHEQTREITIYGTSPEVTYRVHMKGLGWGPWVWDGITAGTTGQGRRLEATEIKLANAPGEMSICYQAYVKGDGWQEPPVCDGEMSGTTGEGRRMEAIKIWLENAPTGCNVEYQAHLKGKDWTDWASNGEMAGTTGESRRMEALRVKISGCP
ncbi:MAG: hypothetical protein K0U98_09450 [Deltaproteobacteria bacterium]|nr:hypothetical protein [Deltaproteobacteria bacterium]